MVDGSIDELKAASKKLIETYGKRRFILGADCSFLQKFHMNESNAIVEAAREI